MTAASLASYSVFGSVDLGIRRQTLSMMRRAKLEQMLEKSPHDTFLNFGLAMELSKEGMTEEAIAQFDRVLQIDPSYLTAYFQKGSALIAAGRVPEASAALAAGIAAANASGDLHTAGEMRALLDTLD